MLELKRELIEGKSKEGREYSFYRYYVTVDGIEVQLYMNKDDKTAPQLLDRAFKTQKTK